MPDLGTYAVPVLSAYAVSFVLIGGLIWVSLRRARRVRAQLEATEARQRNHQSQSQDEGQGRE